MKSQIKSTHVPASGASRRRLPRYVIAMVILLLITGAGHQKTAAQAAGTLDTTFGTAGKVKTPFRIDGGVAFTTVVQTDGKIVTAGNSSCFSPGSCQTDFTIIRYNTNGTLDTSFGIGGKVITDFDSGSSDQTLALALQPDGKIVAAGVTFNGGPTNSDFAIARYNVNGSLDTSFNSNGKIVANFGGGSDDTATGVAIDSSGKIIVVGNTRPTVSSAFLIGCIRFNPDGSTDSSASISYAGSQAFTAAVTIQPWDGRIVIGGTLINAGTRDFLIDRLMPDLTLDGTFGGLGDARADFGGNLDTLNAISFDTVDRSIVAGGVSQNGAGVNMFALAKFTSTGGLDPGFGTAGKVLFSVGTIADIANSVMVRPDRKIVAAGSSSRVSGTDFAVARFLSNGTPDASFGLLGQTTTFINNSAQAFSGVLQTDGKIILAGRASVTSSISSTSAYALSRYGTDGVLDASFGSGGIVTTALGSEDVARKTIIQPDGKIVVAGSTEANRTNGNRDFALARFNADGTLDPTFGTGGKVTTDFRNGDDAAFSMAIQADGKIVAAGTSSSGIKYDFALARYNADGSLDTTFDGDGKVVIDLLSDNEFLYDIAIQSTGDLIVVGENAILPVIGDFVVLRVKPVGVLDTTFGTGGLVLTDFGGGTNDKSLAVALQPDDKIVVAGETSTGSIFSTDFAIARYNPDGTLDTAFSGDGKATVSFGGMLERALDVAIGADGNPVLAGFVQNSATDFDFALARFKPDGSLDTAFDVDGRATISFGTSLESATALAIQTDGKIVAAGYSYGSPPNIALARLNYDGSPDTFFGTGGKTTTDLGGADFAYGVAIQLDGKIVAAGSAETLSDTDFAMARYNAAVPTAAGIGLSGRVTTADGHGIARATISLTSASGESRVTQTGSLGYFSFNDLSAGETYIVTAQAGRYAFRRPSIIINLTDEFAEANFVADPPAGKGMGD